MYLKEQIESLRQTIANNAAREADVSKEEFAKLQQENIKLKHRIAILKRVGLHYIGQTLEVLLCKYDAITLRALFEYMLSHINTLCKHSSDCRSAKAQNRLCILLRYISR